MLKFMPVVTGNLKIVQRIVGRDVHEDEIDTGCFLVYNDGGNDNYIPMILTREDFDKTFVITEGSNIMTRVDLRPAERRSFGGSNPYESAESVGELAAIFARRHKRGLKIAGGVAVMIVAHKLKVRGAIREAAAAGFVLGENSKMSPIEILETLRAVPDMIHIDLGSKAAHFLIADNAAMTLFGDFTKIPDKEVVEAANWFKQSLYAAYNANSTAGKS